MANRTLSPPWGNCELAAILRHGIWPQPGIKQLMGGGLLMAVSIRQPRALKVNTANPRGEESSTGGLFLAARMRGAQPGSGREA